MKNILQILALVILLIPTTRVLAGSDDDEKLYKGARFGYQSSNFSNSDWGDFSGFYVGIFGGKSLGTGKLLSLYSGLEYYETGSYHDADNKIVLSYLSIPLNLRVKIGPVYAFGGFNPSFRIGKDVKVLGQDVSDMSDINGFDIGAQIGVGVKFLFLGVEVKYNQGLTNVYTGANGDDNTTHHLQAGLCVYF